jgi:radical SAM superfamily enzyme YgiQ (UPF0313 family)
MTAGVPVLFLQDNAINESLALCDLAGVLEAEGHRTLLLLEDEEPDLAGAIRQADPALVVVPSGVGGHETARRLAAAARAHASGATIVMGGTHATFDPTEALRPEVDAVVVGEAERPVAALAAHLSAGTDWRGVGSLAWSDRGELVQNPLLAPVEDLDALPHPHRDLYYRYPFIRRFGWKKFNTSRGCVHSCTFCWNPSLRRLMPDGVSFTRRKSPARAVDEVVALRARHPLTSVHFADDLFTVGVGWLERFAPLWRARVGLPFTCSSSIELVTERSVAALAAAGCRGVAIGLETGNEVIRSRILKKTVTNDDVRRSAALIKGHDMELTTYNMLACPGETLDDAWSTVRLNQEIGADFCRVTLAVPIPHTDFEREAIAAGHLDPADLDARVDALNTGRAGFRSADSRAFSNLFYLFRVAVHHPRLLPAIRRAVHLPLGRALTPFKLAMALEERRINRLGWVDGARYFRHVGDPRKRTTNYVTLM